MMLLLCFSEQAHLLSFLPRFTMTHYNMAYPSLSSMCVTRINCLCILPIKPAHTMIFYNEF